MNTRSGWLLAALACPAIGWGAEFFDHDILPRVTALSFEADAIGLLVETPFSESYMAPAFVVDRETFEIRAVSRSEHARLFGARPERLDARAERVTSVGLSYVPEACDGYDGTIRSRLAIAGSELAVDLGNCVSVSEVEVVGNTVWLGTYHAGGHGDWGSRGLLAVSLETQSVVAQVDTGELPVLRVRLDERSRNVWAITPDQIVVADPSGRLVARYFLYYDFDATLRQPTVMAATGAMQSHPLAVLALHLPLDLREQLYTDVQEMPDDVARSFSLYDFYMCCSFASARAESVLPSAFETLVPYLLPTFELHAASYHSRYPHMAGTDAATRQWRQLACRLQGNPDAVALCETPDWRSLTE